jgi:acetyltransferase AlgX (SGNH hydrolase-like protein)
MNMRRTAANALLVIISVTLSLVLVEFLVRVLFPIYDPSGYVKFSRLPDGTPIGPPGAVFRQIKNTRDYDVEVRFNDWGFRDEKPLTTAAKDALFVVGDSFAFGWGVNALDRFSDRLETILNRPVFNIASGSADLVGYQRLVRYVETSGAVVKNLIISVTMENDLGLYDASVDLNSTSENNALLTINLFSLKAHLAAYSAFYHLMTHAVHQTGWLSHIAVQLGIITSNLDGIGNENVSSEALASSVRRVVQLGTGRNVVVLVIPSRRLWVGDAARRGDASRVHAAFIELLRTAGLQVVDMRQRIEADGNPLSKHFANDGHWKPVGHRLAAEALGEVLQHWD